MSGLKTGLFCLCLWCCACTDRESVPAGVIPRDSMQVILRDVITADHFASEFVMKDSLRKDSVHRDVKRQARQLYETVFALHHITKQEFQNSLDFYYSRPDLLKLMFDSLASSENRHRNDLYRPKTPLPPPHPVDSSRTAAERLIDSLKAVHHLNPDSVKRINHPNFKEPLLHPVRKDSARPGAHHKSAI